jgi:hypothetical protein
MTVGEKALRGNQHPGAEIFFAIVAGDVNFQYPVPPLRRAGSGGCAGANEQEQQERGEKKEGAASRHMNLCGPWHVIQKFNVRHVQDHLKINKRSNDNQYLKTSLRVGSSGSALA